MLSALLATKVINSSVVCDDVTGLPFKFEAERYMGTWYETYRTAGMPFQPDGNTCTTGTYSNLNADGTFDVYNSGQDANYGPREGLAGNAKCPPGSEFGEGRCYVSFYGAPWEAEPNYNIIDTDYDNYAIIYSCDDFQYLWFLARDTELSDELYDQLIETVKEKLPNYDLSQLIKDS